MRGRLAYVAAVPFSDLLRQMDVHQPLNLHDLLLSPANLEMAVFVHTLAH